MRTSYLRVFYVPGYPRYSRRVDNHAGVDIALSENMRRHTLELLARQEHELLGRWLGVRQRGGRAGQTGRAY